MTTALILPISGPYTCTWNGNSVGTQNDDGFRLMGQYQGQEINLSDAYGMTLVEAIYRGINWRVRFTGLEFNREGLLSCLQAFGSSGDPTKTFTPVLGTNQVGGGSIGNRVSNFSKALLMNSILPVQAQGAAFAASANPSYVSSLTALSAAPAPQSSFEHLYTSKLREAPMELVLLPYQTVIGSLTVNTAFTTT